MYRQRWSSEKEGEPLTWRLGSPVFFLRWGGIDAWERKGKKQSKEGFGFLKNTLLWKRFSPFVERTGTNVWAPAGTPAWGAPGTTWRPVPQTSRFRRPSSSLFGSQRRVGKSSASLCRVPRVVGMERFVTVWLVWVPRWVHSEVPSLAHCYFISLLPVFPSRWLSTL